MTRQTRKKLGLMAVVRNEEYFIQEWLWFHRFAGVEKFYLAFLGDDDAIAKIKELPFADDVCVYHNFTSINNNDKPITNIDCYRFLMYDHREEVEWMILGDVDEFFFHADKVDLKQALQQFEKKNCGGVIVPWTSMGLSEYIGRPPLPITDHLVLQQQQQQQQQQQYKVIVRTDAYVGCSLDWFLEVTKPYIYQGGGEIQQHGAMVADVYYIEDKIKCHHYFARGLQDIVNRHQRYKDDKDYKCNLFSALQWTHSWNTPNEKATIYSNKLREVLGVPSYDATSKNTLFVSLADYKNPDEYTKWFRMTAEMQGVDITWASWGEKWQGFIQNKVKKILDFLKKQEKDKKYAFVLDCSDVLFVKPAEEILDKFNRVYQGGVLFNCDYYKTMWPLADPTLQWFIDSCYGRNGILNAGCYCGLITDIIALLEQVLDIRQEIQTKQYKSYCTKLFSQSKSVRYADKRFDSKGKLIDDDQWILHIMQCEVNPLIKVDQFKRIFALADGISAHPRSVYDRDCIGTAGILHTPHLVVVD